MDMRQAVLKILLTSVIFCSAVSGGCREVWAEMFKEREAQVTYNEKVPEAEGSPGSLYALSAVLMDGESGRILYEKDGENPRPNASTTKVLTCILALENCPGDDYVSVSSKAAAQPDVQLGLEEGEQYYLEDLLYSLMLMSHNDTAVAIAEHVGGSVEEFAELMNEKAREIGCENTYFITPNGLDAEDKNGVHHTTARDLALIMRYAIRNSMFLKITETREYTFSDLNKKRTFSLHNTNALLDMTEGVLSGKTGFTGDAGYCYVCACRQDEKLFIVSLLGCGWPSHKEYKWSDTKKLLAYGDQYFSYRTLWKEPEGYTVEVKNGAEKETTIGDKAFVRGVISVSEKDRTRKLLMKKNEDLDYSLDVKEELQAPVRKGTQIGTYTCRLGGETIASYPVVADRNVEKISFLWCVDQVFHDFFH